MIKPGYVDNSNNRVASVVVRMLAGCAMLTVSGCVVPNDGPLTHEIMSAGAGGNAYEIPKIKTVFDVVEIDERVAGSVRALGYSSLSRTFGFGGETGVPVIGVGDQLQVTIFEAGPDGLFSTVERKSTTIPVVVQPDGRGQIPYVGSVRFAGMTIDSARDTIVEALKAKAVEPDVIVSMAKNNSRTVSVLGDVRSASVLELGLNSEHLSEVLARAGGPTKPAYDSFVTLQRGKKTGTVLLQSIIDNPSEDIFVRPDDQIYVTYDPQTFSVLGQTGKPGKIAFEARQLNVIEAAALAGGSNVATADPSGYFIFRYEFENAYRQVVGDDRFRELLARGMTPNEQGMYPIVYRLDMNKPQAYIVAQNFPVRNKDVVYLSRHPATDFQKFMQIVSLSASGARNLDLTFR